jgi:hypothetical protein
MSLRPCSFRDTNIDLCFAVPHAVPYPMMLPQSAPIPQGAPGGHPYEGQGGPPVQPGAPGPMGVGH